MKKKWIFLTILVILVVLVGLGAAAYYFVPRNLPAIERWVMSVPPESQNA